MVSEEPLPRAFRLASSSNNATVDSAQRTSVVANGQVHGTACSDESFSANYDFTMTVRVHSTAGGSVAVGVLPHNSRAFCRAGVVGSKEVPGSVACRVTSTSVEILVAGKALMKDARAVPLPADVAVTCGRNSVAFALAGRALECETLRFVELEGSWCLGIGLTAVGQHAESVDPERASGRAASPTPPRQASSPSAASPRAAAAAARATSALASASGTTVLPLAAASPRSPLHGGNPPQGATSETATRALPAQPTQPVQPAHAAHARFTAAFALQQQWDSMLVSPDGLSVFRSANGTATATTQQVFDARAAFTVTVRIENLGSHPALATVGVLNADATDACACTMLGDDGIGTPSAGCIVSARQQVALQLDGRTLFYDGCRIQQTVDVTMTFNQGMLGFSVDGAEVPSERLASSGACTDVHGRFRMGISLTRHRQRATITHCVPVAIVPTIPRPRVAVPFTDALDLLDCWRSIDVFNDGKSLLCVDGRTVTALSLQSFTPTAAFAVAVRLEQLCGGRIAVGIVGAGCREACGSNALGSSELEPSLACSVGGDEVRIAHRGQTLYRYNGCPTPCGTVVSMCFNQGRLAFRVGSHVVSSPALAALTFTTGAYRLGVSVEREGQSATIDCIGPPELHDVTTTPQQPSPAMPTVPHGDAFVAQLRRDLAAELPQLQRIIADALAVRDARLWSNPGTRMTPDGALAVALYTGDLLSDSTRPDHSDNFFHVCNAAQRAQNPEQMRRWAPFFHHWSVAMAALPAHTGRFYRGLPHSSVATVREQYRRGAHVTWTGITSASRSRDVALRFALKEAQAPGVVFEIAAVDARDASAFSDVPQEEEIVLQRTPLVVDAEPYVDHVSGCLIVTLVQLAGPPVVF